MEVNMFKPYTHYANYYETDQMGIIHHSNYIRWMEEARLDVLNQAGISYREMEEAGIIIPVLSVSCEYKRMVCFGDTVSITVHTEKYNGVKLDVANEMADIATGELCTTAKSSHCFLDGKSHKVLSLKYASPELHEKFKKLLEE